MSVIRQPCDRDLEHLLNKRDGGININAGIDSGCGHPRQKNDAKLGFLSPGELKRIHTSPTWKRKKEIENEQPKLMATANISSKTQNGINSTV
ncbi:unnamed protein product, partial [Didymodactylos carnosus]